MARGLDARKYFWRSGREKCFSLDIPFYRTSGPESPVSRSSGHDRQKDPRGYLWPTDITNSLVSENSVIDHFGESNRPGLLLPRGLENRFQEAAVFI